MFVPNTRGRDQALHNDSVLSDAISEADGGRGSRSIEAFLDSLVDQTRQADEIVVDHGDG